VRDTGARSWSVVLVPDDDAALFASRNVGDQTRIVEGVAAPSAAVEPFGGFRLALRLDGSRLQATVNGQERLSWDTGADTAGAVSVRARDGAVRLLSVEAKGRSTSQRGQPEPFSWRDDFDDLAAISPWPARMHTAALALLTLLAAAAFLSALCRAAPGPGLLVAATLWWAAPPSVLAAAVAVASTRPPPWLPAATSGTALVGLLLAIRTLRGVLRPAPGTMQRPARLSLALLLLVVTAVFAGQARIDAFAPARAAADEARALTLPAPASDTTRQVLDASNALTLPGPHRNLDFGTRVRLTPGSALQVRLRAADPDVPAGVTLVLPADERRAMSFRREEPWSFAPLGGNGGRQSPAVAPDTWVRLDVKVTGDRFDAFLDGELVARADSRDHAAGAVVLTAAPGRVELDGWTLVPRPHEPAASTWLDGLPPVLWLAGGLVLLATLLSRLLRMPLGDALAPMPWALAPLVAVLLTADPAGRPAVDALTPALQATCVLLLAFTLIHARGAGTLLAVAAVLTGPPLLTGRAIERAPDPGAVASYAHWSGTRAHDDLLWIEHPLLRRWNPYLARHRFRGRSFPLSPAEGTHRVIVLGGSSTWGFRLPEDSGADWPTQLQSVLTARDVGNVEVLNGAWSGATGDRLYRFFRDVLLEFEPDVVVLNLYYNDAWALSQGTEEEYYARTTADGYSRGWLDAWRDPREVAAGRADLRRLMAATAPNVGGLAGRTTQAVWDEVAPGRRSPAERYGSMLERFARLTAREGLPLILVKEPMRDDQESLWKVEFHAVMDAIAAEHGLTVVDPRDALRAASDGRLFLDEIHLTPRGHAVLAEAVAPAVQDALRAADR
jgi:lysophospholipase L1-like esterase